jgi:hypothetical protein
MTREERIVAALVKELTPELHKEITLLRRKLKRALEQRDVWAEAARRYQKQVLGKQ